MPKVVTSQFRALLNRKAKAEGKRIRLRELAKTLDLSYYTLNELAHDRLEHYPRDVLAKLCDYLDCTVGQLLVLTDMPDYEPSNSKAESEGDDED
jgi:DNA-binding Xre family transcriptional regulator